MVPFQFVIIKSSPSARPYEHASAMWSASSPSALRTEG
jgi:hypothetical protein